MLSGIIYPLGKSQSILRTKKGDYLIPGPEISRLGLWQEKQFGLLWGMPAIAAPDPRFNWRPAPDGVIGVIEKNSLSISERLNARSA